MNNLRLRNFAFVLSIVLGGAQFGCGARTQVAMTYQKQFHMDRFMGLWNEAARLPLLFENDCVAASVHFMEGKSSERVQITTYCWYKSLNGPMRKFEARGQIYDLTQQAKLTIRFAGPAVFKYWILYVNDDYTYALAGSPDRKRLWLLSRSLSPEPEQIKRLLQEALDRGFDLSKLILSPEVEKMKLDLSVYKEQKVAHNG